MTTIPDFYVFASTCRAGEHNHKFVAPETVSIPAQILKTDTGEDRTSVEQMVEQATAERRKGKEMLIFVAPGRKLTHCKKEHINELLRGYQDRLAELATQKIDWNKTSSGLVIRHQELDTWMDELQPRVRPILVGTVSSTSKNSNPLKKIMQPKVLFVAVALLIVLGLLVKGQNLVDWGKLRFQPRDVPQNIGDAFQDIMGEIMGRDASSSREVVLSTWIRELDIQTHLNPSQEEMGSAILQKLNSLFAPEKSFDNLFDCLRVLNECLGRPYQGREPTPDQLLSNEQLRGQIRQVIGNNRTSMCTKPHDEVESTLLRLFSDSTPENIRKRFASLRQLLIAASDISKRGEDFASPSEEENWLRFAGERLFLKAGEDKSAGYKENVADREPQFVTAADIELSKYVYEWLKSDGARPLLNNHRRYSNLEEALHGVVEGGTAIQRSPFMNFQTHGEKDLFITSNISEERAKQRELLEAFLRFREHATEIVGQINASRR